MIEIFNVNPINKGDLLASCSIHIQPWKLKIHKVMVFQKGINRWVSFPREKYEVGGETKYTDLMELTDPGATKRFRDQVVEAVEAYIAQNGDMVPEDVIKDNQDFPF
jgi:hypothetical protein